MKVVDINVLLYAVNENENRHELARTWLTAALADRVGLGLTWYAVMGFLRLATHPTILPRPLGMREAGRAAAAWIQAPAAVLLQPGPNHVEMVTRLMADLPGGNLVNDAHLAALALEHDGEVITFDRDFGRFEGVRWSMPRPT